MTRYAACTIVARNYTAQARVLVRSFVVEHARIPFFTLIIDGDDSDRLMDGVGTVVLPEDLGLEPSLLHRMMVMYDVMELATALKPAMLMHLVRSGAEAAAYFDPDIRVYAGVQDVFDSAREHGIFLTPHTLFPIPRDGHNLSEQQIMHAGIYNLGFICVGASAYRFLAWWHERLQVDAIVDLENALFTDQRWIDWVPALFRHTITRDQGLNAAYWNLHEREIEYLGDGYRAGADPLRFFHFSGYDPGMPWLLSKHMGDDPRILLSAHPDLARLCDDYARELIEFGHPELRKTPYRLNWLPNGTPLGKAVRRFYRQLVTGTVVPPIDLPDPIDDADAFVAWLLEPMFGQPPFVFSPAEYALWWERGDVRNTIHRPLDIDGPGYRRWLGLDPYVQSELGPLLARRPNRGHEAENSSARRPLERRAFGWSVVAPATSELGFDELAMRMSSSLTGLGMPIETVAITAGAVPRQQRRSGRALVDSVQYENAVICVNAGDVAHVSHVMDLSSLRGRKAGLWFWELETFPPEHIRQMSYLTEVWVTNSFTYDALVAEADRPVHRVRLPIAIPSEATRFTRRGLGMPHDKFVFATSFDFLSVLRRTNPLGVIEAYCAAFGPEDGAVLVVKSVNGHRRPVDFERMRRAADERPDVIFHDDSMPSSAVTGMIELADCFVSLHRSVSYGLALADAMAHGTPVIATAYSGNLDFMTPETSELIPFEFTEVGPSAGEFNPLAGWAEPDLHLASEAMRRLFDDRAVGDKLSKAAIRHLRENFSPAAAAAALRPVVLPSPVAPQKIDLERVS